MAFRAEVAALVRFQLLNRLVPGPAAVQAADRADAAGVVACLDRDIFAVDQAVGDFLSRSGQNTLKSRPRHFHAAGAVLLLKTFQILEPDRLQLFQLEHIARNRLAGLFGWDEMLEARQIFNSPPLDWSGQNDTPLVLSCDIQREYQRISCFHRSIGPVRCQ